MLPTATIATRTAQHTAGADERGTARRSAHCRDTLLHALAEGFSKPGDHVELEAEMDALAVNANCAQLHNPVDGFNPTPIRVIVFRR